MRCGCDDEKNNILVEHEEFFYIHLFFRVSVHVCVCVSGELEKENKQIELKYKLIWLGMFFWGF